MVHVHGKQVAARAATIARATASRVVVVPVDVGKRTAMALIADAAGEQLVAPFTFSMDGPGLAVLVSRVEKVAAARDTSVVRVGVEAAGHYHRPVVASGVLPEAWEVIELNPGHVTEQRRVLGKRGVKTDQVDLVAMFDLLVAGRGHPAGRRERELLELRAWVGMRQRRVAAATALKNQVLGQMDRAFPGAGACVSTSLLTAKIGRLVLAEFSDPDRLVRLGVERFRQFAARRDVTVQRPVARRFVAAARAACPPAAGGRPGAAGRARDPDRSCRRRAGAAAAHHALPGPDHHARLVDRPRRPLCRRRGRPGPLADSTAGLPDSRSDPEAARVRRQPRPRVAELKARGKPAGIIACAMANRANRIAYAMVRHQTPYQPHRWSR